MGESFIVEVCYALAEAQELVSLKVQPGCTIGEAIEASGIAWRSGIDLTQIRVGIYGKLKTIETLVRPGDRIEIYRKLIVDPNTARLRRHLKNQASRVKRQIQA